MTPTIRKAMHKRKAAEKLSPVIANCSARKAGKTTVGNIANDEPATIPRIK